MNQVRSVDERITQARGLDHTSAHERIGLGMRRLAARLRDAFTMAPHPMAAPFARYGGSDLRGELRAFTGERLDWVIDSWIGSPERGFCNHHLTIWLDDSVAVPHLAFAIGTIPDLFVFCDMVPRSDLWVDLASLDRYHQALNDVRLEVWDDPRFAPFVSKAAYIRQAISPIGLCEVAQPTEENIQRAFTLFDRFMDVWLSFMRDAEPVPESERAGLRARDRIVRRAIVERDPANIIAERLLGPDMTRDLVRVLGRLES